MYRFYKVNANSRPRKFLFWLVIFIILLSLAVQPALAGNANPKVLPPNSKPFGRTYNQWSAEWWRYVLRYPSSNNPLTDPTGANCGLGQSGPVFFLVGTTGGDAVRDDCVVPPGKALYFPLENFFCAVPEDGATSQEIRDLCIPVTDSIDELFVTVDGVPLQNLFDYRFPSPDFSFTGAVDNPFDQSCGNPGTCYEGYHEIGFADGYYVMLTPLTPGEHTIRFGGHYFYEPWNWEGSIDVTYNLTVARNGLGR